MPSASLSRCWPLLWGLCLGLTLPGSGASAQSGAPASPLKGRTWELIPVGDAAATGDDTAAGEGSTPEKKPQAPTPAEPSALPSVPAPTAAALQPPAGQLDETDEPSHPAPKRGPRVALIDFESTTLDKDQVKALSQALWARLDASPDLALFPRSATRRWLIRHDLFPFTPYQAPVTAEKVTSALKADYLLTGHLDQIDGSFSLDINLYSNRARRCILQDVKIEKASWDALLESFAPLGKQLYLAVIGNETVLASQFGPQPEPPAAEIPPLTVKPQPLPPVTKTETPKSQGASKTGRNTKKSADPAPAPRATPRPRTTPPEQTPRPERTALTEKPRPAAKPKPQTEPAATHEAAPRATPTPTPRPTATPTPRATPPAARPEGASADLARAKALYEEGLKLKAASPERLVKLTQAADLAPAESRYQQQLAMEYYNQGDFKSCIARIDRAMQAQPDNSMLLTIKGSAFIELGNYEQAARSHEAALQKDPKNVWAAYNLALALGLAHSERTAGAWRDFIALAEKDPEQRDLVERARKSLADLEGNR